MCTSEWKYKLPAQTWDANNSNDISVYRTFRDWILKSVCFVYEIPSFLIKPLVMCHSDAIASPASPMRKVRFAELHSFLQGSPRERNSEFYTWTLIGNWVHGRCVDVIIFFTLCFLSWWIDAVMIGCCFQNPGSEHHLLRNEVQGGGGGSAFPLIRKLNGRGSYFQELPHPQLRQQVTHYELDKWIPEVVELWQT